MYSPSNRFLVSARIDGFLDEELREYTHARQIDTSQFLRDLIAKELDGWRTREHKPESIHKDLAELTHRAKQRQAFKESLVVSAGMYDADPNYFEEQCHKYGFDPDEILSLHKHSEKKINLTGISACEYFILGRLSILGEEESVKLRAACADSGFTRSDIDRAFKNKTITERKDGVYTKLLK